MTRKSDRWWLIQVDHILRQLDKKIQVDEIYFVDGPSFSDLMVHLTFDFRGGGSRVWIYRVPMVSMRSDPGFDKRLRHEIHNVFAAKQLELEVAKQKALEASMATLQMFQNKGSYNPPTRWLRY